jgi:hypothetical protein
MYLWVQIVLWFYNTIHVVRLWVGKRVFVVLQRAQVYQKAIDSNVLLILQSVQSKWWQHNDISFAKGHLRTIDQQRETALQHFGNKKLLVPHCWAKGN